MSQATDELIAQAQDPNAPLETLHQLAQNYPDLRPYIAANPRTYPALLEWLGTLEDPAVNAALAARAGDGAADSTQVLSPQPSDAATGVLPSSGTGMSPTPQETQVTEVTQVPQSSAGHTVARTVGAPPDMTSQATSQATSVMGTPGVPVPSAPSAAPASAASMTSAASAVSAVSAAQPVSAASAASAPPALPPQSYTQAIPAQPGASTPQPFQPQPLPQPLASPYQQQPPASPATVAPVPASASDPAVSAATQVVGSAPQAGEQAHWPSVPPAQVQATYPGQPNPPRQPTTPVRRSTQVASGAAAYTAASGAGVSQTSLPQPAAASADGAVFGVGTEDTASAAPSGRLLWILAVAVAALVVFIATWYLTGNNNDSSADNQGAEQPSSASQQTSALSEPSSSQASPSASPTPSATPSQRLTAPAPGDAMEMSTFTSPSGNITCVLSADSVSCTINEYDFATTDSSCTGSSTPFTATVGNSGKATGSCGQSFSPSGASLQYGYSAKNETFACTSDSSGIECWSQVSGEGFRLSRATSSATQR